MGLAVKIINGLLDRVIAAEQDRTAAHAERDTALAEWDEVERALYATSEEAEETAAVLGRTRARLRWARITILSLRAARDQYIAEANDLDDEMAGHRWHRLTTMSTMVRREQIRARTLRAAQRYRRTITDLRLIVRSQDDEIERLEEAARWAAIDAQNADAVRERDALHAEIGASIPTAAQAARLVAQWWHEGACYTLHMTPGDGAVAGIVEEQHAPLADLHARYHARYQPPAPPEGDGDHGTGE